MHNAANHGGKSLAAKGAPAPHPQRRSVKLLLQLVHQRNGALAFQGEEGLQARPVVVAGTRVQQLLSLRLARHLQLQQLLQRTACLLRSCCWLLLPGQANGHRTQLLHGASLR